MAQAQVQRQADLSAKAREAAGRLFDRFDGLSDAAQRAYADAMAQTMGPIRQASARSTQAYLRTVERQAAGVATETGDLAAIASEVRAGLPMTEVYSRPFVTARTAIAEGKDYATARLLGRGRAETIADTDVILSQNLAAKDLMTRSSRIVGHRRVPEAGACPFCLLVSTQRYTVDELQPVHNNCHCGVIPIIGSKDPGRVLEPDLLKSLKDQLGMTTKPNPDSAFKKFVKIENHGELGPVITQKAPLPEAKSAPQRKLNAGDLTTSEGVRIANAANEHLAGKMTRKEYLQVVKEVKASASLRRA